MAKFGLIGHPIAHSKSPALFMAAYPDYEHSYDLIEGEDLHKVICRFFEDEYKGINVTSPFKDKVMQYVTEPDRISSLLGSANVLIKDNGFSLDNPLVKSYNTDYYGVKNAFLEFTGGNGNYIGGAADQIKVIRNVLVVGAGGAGKAAALAMRDLGYKVVIANRSAGRVGEFAGSIGAGYVSLENIAPYVEEADVIIYSLSFLIDGFEKYDLGRKILFEANYAKPSLAPANGINSLAYIDGKKWLYNQAVPAFELFTGEAPNALLMRGVIGCL